MRHIDRSQNIAFLSSLIYRKPCYLRWLFFYASCKDIHSIQSIHYLFTIDFSDSTNFSFGRYSDQSLTLLPMAKNYKMISHNDEEIAKLIARLEVMYEGRNFEEIQSIAFNLSSFANATMLRVGFLNISERLPEYRDLLLLSMRCFVSNQGFVSPLRYFESPDSSEYHEHVALFIRAMKNLFEALENNETTDELEGY